MEHFTDLLSLHWITVDLKGIASQESGKTASLCLYSCTLSAQFPLVIKPRQSQCQSSPIISQSRWICHPVFWCKNGSSSWAVALFKDEIKVKPPALMISPLTGLRVFDSPFLGIALKKWKELFSDCLCCRPRLFSSQKTHPFWTYYGGEKKLALFWYCDHLRWVGFWREWHAEVLFHRTVCQFNDSVLAARLKVSW